MNLAEYEKLDTGSSASRGDFIGFEKTGDTRYLRFMYESGGENMGADIPTRRKKWDEADGSNPRRVRWERSAYFCKNTLLPMWKNYPRIIDGVWKVTATNPKTMDASYALFPVMGADTIKYPIIEDKKEEKKEEAKPAQPTAPAAEAPRKKYWE